MVNDDDDDYKSAYIIQNPSLNDNEHYFNETHRPFDHTFCSYLPIELTIEQFREAKIMERVQFNIQ